jgi:hypothetical protein
MDYVVLCNSIFCFCHVEKPVSCHVSPFQGEDFWGIMPTQGVALGCYAQPLQGKDCVLIRQPKLIDQISNKIATHYSLFTIHYSLFVFLIFWHWTGR